MKKSVIMQTIHNEFILSIIPTAFYELCYYKRKKLICSKIQGGIYEKERKDKIEP